MSTGRYGMLREVEYDFIDEITLWLRRDFGEIRFLEIGVCGGGTMRGIHRRAKEINCPIHAAGVDWPKHFPNPLPAPDYEYFSGDSMDMWRKIKGAFNFLFVDGCHCINHSMCDFLNYSAFVVLGGYALFHDTAILPGGKDGDQARFGQNHAYIGQPDSELGVRDGLRKMGLLQGYRSDWTLVREVTSETDVMGMMCFKRLKSF